MLELLEAPALGVRSAAAVAVAFALPRGPLRDTGAFAVFVVVFVAGSAAALAALFAAVLFVAVAWVRAGFFPETGSATVAFWGGADFFAGSRLATAAFTVGADFFAGTGLATAAFTVGADFFAGTGLAATVSFLGAGLLVAGPAMATVASVVPFAAGAVLPASAALIADIAFFTAMLGSLTVALRRPTNADRWREDKAILRRTQCRNAAASSVSPSKDS